MTSARTPGRAGERGRDDARADLPDDVLVAEVVRAAGHREVDQRDVAVGRDVRRRPARSTPGIARTAVDQLLRSRPSSAAGRPGSRRRRGRGPSRVGHFALSRFTAWTTSSESGKTRSRSGPRWSRSTGEASDDQSAAADDGGDDRPAHDRPDDVGPEPAALRSRSRPRNGSRSRLRRRRGSRGSPAGTSASR